MALGRVSCRLGCSASLASGLGWRNGTGSPCAGCALPWLGCCGSRPSGASLRDGPVGGQPGNEIFLVIRNVGARWSFRDDPLYLQFRGGRLTGWKADWSRNWMWR